MPIDVEVTEIEGVGPATAQLLSGIGVEQVADLLHVTTAAVHRAVASVASLEEVEAWRAMAYLMEVEDIDGQLAEALHSAGIETVDELAFQVLSTLRSTFGTAEQSGAIDEVPDEDAIVSIVSGAMAILCGAVAMGALVDTDGTPVQGATIRMGNHKTTTNQNGRYRLAGLPAAAAYSLRVEVDETVVLFAPEIEVYSDHRLIGGESRTVDEKTGTFTADEFLGEDLPPLTSYRAIWQRFEPDGLREGDVYWVLERYDKTNEVKIVSIFRAFANGDLIVHHCRIGTDAFEGIDPQPGDHFRYRNEQMIAVPGGISALEAYRAAKRVAAEMRANDDGGSGDFESRVAAFNEAFARHYGLGVSHPEKG